MKDSTAMRHKLPDPIEERHVDDERGARFEAMFDAHAGRVFAYAARRSSPDMANEVVG